MSRAHLELYVTDSAGSKLSVQNEDWLLKRSKKKYTILAIKLGSGSSTKRPNNTMHADHQLGGNLLTSVPRLRIFVFLCLSPGMLPVGDSNRWVVY